jgi:transcriptional regulator with XRE-family HTH domain
MLRMVTRTNPAAEALFDARRMRSDMGREIRIARRGLGVSQQEAGARVGMSHAQFGRVERATLEQVTVVQLSRACAAVGLRLIVRAVPGGDPPLDAGQLALLGRLRRELAATIRMVTEVPLPIAGDRRAWDAMLRMPDDAVAVEAETRITDLQALERRCALKQRDGRIQRLILLIADTRANRGVLSLHREVLRPRFPLEPRQLLGDLRRGQLPAQSGIVVL